jgi:TatD DNase family protein
MHLIDTHAHIYLPEFDEDRLNILENAKAVGIEMIIMPAIDSSTHKVMLDLEKNFKECISMIGLHPCSVNQDYTKELQVVKDYLEQKKFVAIGEIGLDFYWDKTFVTQQYDAFHQQINLALNNKIPIAIHSRNATRECIEVIKQYEGISGVFHCFSGTYQEATEIMELGFMLGIGGVLTFKNAGLDKIIEKTGLDHIILETDAPYLAPVPYRGKRNEPSYLALVADKLATLSGRLKEEVSEITTQNAKKLFNL